MPESGSTARPLAVLVTHHYPHVDDGGEVMFIAPGPERLALEPASDVRVVPLTDTGPVLDVPAGVFVDLSLARALRVGAERAFRLAALRGPLP